MAAASTTATYRIGPSDTFTGGDLQADADTLQSQVTDLDNQIEGNETLSSTDVEQWVAFQGRWAAFYTKFGSFIGNTVAALNDSNRDQLIQFEKDFANFATTFEGEGLVIAGGVVQPSTGAGDTLGAHLAGELGGLGLPSSTMILLGLGLILAIVIFWKEG